MAFAIKEEAGSQKSDSKAEIQCESQPKETKQAEAPASEEERANSLIRLAGEGGWGGEGGSPATKVVSLVKSYAPINIVPDAEIVCENEDLKEALTSDELIEEAQALLASEDSCGPLQDLAEDQIECLKLALPNEE